MLISYRVTPVLRIYVLGIVEQLHTSRLQIRIDDLLRRKEMIARLPIPYAQDATPTGTW